MSLKYIIPLLIALSLTSCHISNSTSTAGEEELILPDMVLEKGTFTLYQERERPIEFSAGKATFYSKDNRAVIEDISFEQRDGSGALIIEGHADSGEIDTENELLKLKGNVYLNSIRDEMKIETDGKMSFDTKSQEVESSSYVTVTSPDGEFSSHAFYGNLLMEEYSFSNLEEGRIVI